MKSARVIAEHKTNYVIADGGSEYVATVRGSFFTSDSFPKVGDYVEYHLVSKDKAVIEAIQPRTSTIARRAVESRGEQVIVANVTLVCIVMGLDGDFNVSRLERYLLLARQSGVPAVIILNKSDCAVDGEASVRAVAAVAGDAPVQVVSAATGDNMPSLLPYFEPTTTAVLLGSSGAGKSTIINWLLQHRVQAVNEVREGDSRGRHTTTYRQLFLLPGGGSIIDTPGMRELGVESTEATEDEVFAIIEELSRSCRFSNCDHEKSEGCALLYAVSEGTLSNRQLKNYLKIKRERLHEERKYDAELARTSKEKQKKRNKQYNQMQRARRDEEGLA